MRVRTAEQVPTDKKLHQMVAILKQDQISNLIREMTKNMKGKKAPITSH